ncbi:hypothetical protein GALL_357780 [mine drainage metagenome]|uniref:Uncharacterized protein n=1 Tax=mine drainage metagenome TaxID=410659 RepID=A0A1J5R2R0_9ZZZZ
MTPNRIPLHALALAACLALGACGGGSGGGTSNAAAGSTSPTGSGSPAQQNFAMKGSAVDGPIANAQITITAGAPLGDAGATTIGTATADASGNYTVTPQLPSGSVPIFANVTDPNNPALKMSSYLGQSDTLASAGALDSSKVPNLNVTPITTAALAVYAQLNADDYAKLSPSIYADAVTAYNSTVVSIASAIKAVGDNLCKPSSEVSSTIGLASQIARTSAAANGPATALSTAINTLGSDCSSVLTELPNLVTGDPSYANQLTYGTGVPHPTSVVVPGTYTLAGVAMQNGLSPEVDISSLATAAHEIPADVVTDTQVTIGSDGTISSTDGRVTGITKGPLIYLTLSDPGSGVTYDLKGTIQPLPSASVNGTAYSVRTSGTYPSAPGGPPLLARFDAVLAAPSANPIWNGTATKATASAEQVDCTAPQMPLRLDVFGPDAGSFGMCLSSTPTSWTFAAAQPSSIDVVLGLLSGGTVQPPSLSAGTWTELSDTPFILSLGKSSITLGGRSFSGTGYHVMGSRSLMLSASSGASTSAADNILIAMHGPVLDSPPPLPSASSASAAGASADPAQSDAQP